jgi:hypothetical protein
VTAQKKPNGAVGRYKAASSMVAPSFGWIFKNIRRRLGFTLRLEGWKWKWKWNGIWKGLSLWSEYKATERQSMQTLSWVGQAGWVYLNRETSSNHFSAFTSKTLSMIVFQF